jgi:LacI family transcriptional regulator
MPPTIKDVAKRANVSIATVSLAIHGNQRISEETTQKVMQVIKELNYHPSRPARGLVSQKTGNIGFIVTENHFLRSEPFYTQIFLGAEIEAHNHDYYILLTSIPEELPRKIVMPRFVLERNVDGIIVAGKVPDRYLSILMTHNIPIVFVDYFPESTDSNAVLIDNLNGAKLAVEHLVELGHKQIAFIGGDINHPSLSARFDGYKSALEQHALSSASEFFDTFEDNTTRENGYNAARRLLSKNPKITAIFACNDAMAIGVIQYLQEEGIAIPDQVSVIGFDDVDAAGSMSPSLSTIAVPKFELGYEVVRLMDRTIEAKNIASNRVIVGVELVKRNSTGAPSAC